MYNTSAAIWTRIRPTAAFFLLNQQCAWLPSTTLHGHASFIVSAVNAKSGVAITVIFSPFQTKSLGTNLQHHHHLG